MPRNGFFNNEEKATKIVDGRITNPLVRWVYVDEDGLVHFMDQVHIQHIENNVHSPIKKEDLVDIRMERAKAIEMVAESIRMGWQVH